MELKADGASITGTVTGVSFVINAGRIEESSVTVSGINPNTKRPVSLTGSLSGIEIVFRAVGLAPEPVQLVARRVTRPDTVLGSVSDAALMQRLLKETNVPGLSIAVIKDFKVAHTFAYGVADSDTRTPMRPRTMFQAASISKTVAAMASLKAVQEKRFTLDQTSTRSSSRGSCPPASSPKPVPSHRAHS